MRVEIVARHPAFGEVTFILKAPDGKQAFTLWKQIVASPKQWNVVGNSAASESETPSGNQIEQRETRASAPSLNDDWDLNGDSQNRPMARLYAEYRPQTVPGSDADAI